MSKHHQRDEAALARKLEVLRRQSGLSIDIDGHWWHDGTPFEHEGIIAALNQGIELHPDSAEPIVRIGEQWCYIEVAGTTPFLGNRLQVTEAGQVSLKLNTSENIETKDASWHLQFGALHCHLADGRLIRLSRHAQAKLADYLEESTDGYYIVTAAGRWPVLDTQGS